MTADEAHAIHENEIRDWLRAFDADRHMARMLVPDFGYKLLHDLAYLAHGDELTQKGYVACAA